MATRNLTRRFNQLRASHGSSKSAHSVPSSHLEESFSLSSSSGLAGAERKASLPPRYVDFVDLLERDEEAIVDSIKKLRHLHSRRLKVSFADNEHEQDKEINVLTQQIQTLLSRCEKNLKKIASVGNDGRISTEDRICRLNIMRSYARRLQQVSRDFKTSQRNFVMTLKGQNEFGKDFFGETDAANARSFDELNEREEKAVLMEQVSKEHDEEIEKLVESIGAISSLFKELSVLVIDQGSVLDRIDYNVECVLVKAREGREQMEKANEHSKNNRSMICILFLTGMMLFLLLLVILKYSMPS